MTAEEQKGDGHSAAPVEGEDISAKKDGGVLKVPFAKAKAVLMLAAVGRTHALLYCNI